MCCKAFSSGGVLRPYRTVRPCTCSAKVRRPHLGAHQSSDLQHDHHPLAAHCGVVQPPPIPAMDLRGCVLAARTVHRLRPCPSQDPDVTRHPLHTLDLDSSQMREQHSKFVIIAPDGSSLLIAWLRVSIHHEM
jgi:hypothetical protein